MYRTLALFLAVLVYNISEASILDKIQEKIQNSKGIEAEFIQISEIKDFNHKSTFKGYLYISKPDKVKIQYVSPEPNIIFVNGKETIVYNPVEKQAVISELPDQFIVVKIFKLIAEGKDFTQLFDVVKVEEKKNRIVLNLLPKNDKQLKSLSISFSSKNYLIKELDIEDKERNKIKVRFKKFRYLDKPIDIDLKLDKDVEIMRY